MKHDIIEGQDVTIKDGVAYFNSPYFTNSMAFASKYRMRDFIIREPGPDEDNGGGNEAYIIAVPITPNDTRALHRQFKENSMRDKGYTILIGIYEEEGVMYID